MKNEIKKAPIKHWSYSSLMAFLRNPLAWHKRYVEEIYDMPRTPSSIVGSAGHKALEHFYSGATKNFAIQKGFEYLRNVSDFEIDFGKIKSLKAKKEKRRLMEKEYKQAISYYLERPPRHRVLGVEVKGNVEVSGLPLPIKAVSDLVVESRVQRGAVDIVDHKFVSAFSKNGATKSFFIIQAIFNYYTVREIFGKPVRRFIVYECKKTANVKGKSQMKRYTIDFSDLEEDFYFFHRLLNDATKEISRKRIYLPNPSDVFDGWNSLDIYRHKLIEGEKN